MNPRPVVRRISLAVAMLFLLALAWQALAGGFGQIPRCYTIGQQLETIVQFICGLLSLLSVLTYFRWRRAGRPILVAWAISFTSTAGISSLVWGPPSLAVGLAFAAIALLLALGIIRLFRAGLTA